MQMKVKQLIDKFALSSNAMVTIMDTKSRTSVTLSSKAVREGLSSDVTAMRLNSFNVINNTLTIYAE